MFIDDKYDYIEKDKEYYDKVLNDMNNGLGAVEEYDLYLVRYKNDKDNKYIKRVLIKKDEELQLEDNMKYIVLIILLNYIIMIRILKIMKFLIYII